MSEHKDTKGRFAPGNPGGKLKSPTSKKTRAIAEVARELFDQYGTKTAKEIFESRGNFAVKERLIEFLVERGWGKAPQTIRLGGIDPNSPEGVLLAMSGQVLPGAEETPE
jgi:hypothetical protein